jgi:hypothetical protein
LDDGKLTIFDVRQEKPMKKAISVRSLLAFALIACCPFQTRANTIAFGFAPGSYTTFTFGADVTVGLAFTLTSLVLVTDLGLWDFNSDGLNASHVVTVWTMKHGTPFWHCPRKVSI